MRYSFHEIPGKFFVGCGPSDFLDSSYLELEDPKSLNSKILNIKIRRLRDEPLSSTITVRKTNKRLDLDLQISESQIYFGPNSFGKWLVRSWNGSRFTLKGANSRAHNVRCIIERGGAVSIGQDCMFSDEVMLQCGSQHAIFCLEEKKQLNVDNSIIEIGDHCWLARRTTIVSSSRRVEMGAGSILGIGSVLTRSVPAASLAAGAPAKLKRKNVSWSVATKCSKDEIDRIQSIVASFS